MQSARVGGFTPQFRNSRGSRKSPLPADAEARSAPLTGVQNLRSNRAVEGFRCASRPQRTRKATSAKGLRRQGQLLVRPAPDGARRHAHRRPHPLCQSVPGYRPWHAEFDDGTGYRASAGRLALEVATCPIARRVDDGASRTGRCREPVCAIGRARYWMPVTCHQRIEPPWTNGPGAAIATPRVPTYRTDFRGPSVALHRTPRWKRLPAQRVAQRARWDEHRLQARRSYPRNCCCNLSISGGADCWPSWSRARSSSSRARSLSPAAARYCTSSSR